MASIKQAEKLCLTYQATGGNLTLKLDTSLAGAALATAHTLTLPATTGFVTQEFNLRDVNLVPLEFVQIRFELTAASGARGEIQAMTLHLREVGTYVNGTAGIIWRTDPPLSFGG